MKYFQIAIILFFFSSFLHAQEPTDSSSTDSTVFRWGNSKIIVINTKKYDSPKKENKKGKQKSSERWNHFAGIDLGINGLLSPTNSVDLQKEAAFMDLNYIKSIAIGINFFEYYIPIAQEKFGISTGMGFTFNNYDLSRDYTIISNSDSTIGTVNNQKSIKKNKFKRTAVNVPVFLETNIGKGAKKSFHLAIGGMASYFIGTKTKQIYKINGQQYKTKKRTDFNTNPFQLAAHLRIGYGDFTLFANYSLTPLFDKDEGPELYPFTIGLSLVSF